ncbi:hypothetical protein ANCDUO_04339 [Ancylostoma duodenale]|uniref:Uncharacterized protein n=1 Tax=Ancylostoma duodenale TaxID=51022 RepID=A0A0C2D6U7_9BILA|nr:hypothetical protein ANCDUO_04339 [Ancylostoma duodenale]
MERTGSRAASLRGRRVAITQEEREIRRRREGERLRASREAQTQEQRDVDLEGRKMRRSTESEEQVEYRRSQERNRWRQRVEGLSEEERQFRRAQRAAHMREQRWLEAERWRQERIRSMRERYADGIEEEVRENRWARYIVSGMPVSIAQEHYAGVMDVRCTECGALSFRGKCATDRSKEGFNMCCNFGNVIIPRFRNFPVELKSILQDHTSEVGQQFRKNIRRYNSALAMASMGANVEVPQRHGP